MKHYEDISEMDSIRPDKLPPFQPLPTHRNTPAMQDYRIADVRIQEDVPSQGFNALTDGQDRPRLM
jgi:hypothetical protein